MSEVTLTYTRCQQVSLADVLAAAHGAVGMEGAVALLMTPDRCLVGRVDAAGVVLDATGSPVAFDGVFELRAFSPSHELRWTRHWERGRALLLGEKECPGLEGWALAPPVPVEILTESHRLLLGRVRRPAGPGWIELAEARIRPFQVPCSAPTQDRVAVRVREYARTDLEHGNVYVCEERLLRLEKAPPPQDRP